MKSSARPAPIVSTLVRPVVLDNRTRIERILVSRVSCGWLVVDQDAHHTIFLPWPCKEPLEVMDDVKRVVFEYNVHAEMRSGGGDPIWHKHYNPTKICATRWALLHYLLTLEMGDFPKIPQEINVEPIRLKMVLNQMERDRVELEAKDKWEQRKHKKRKIHVVIIDDD